MKKQKPATKSQQSQGRTWGLVLMLGTPLVVVGAFAMLITFATLVDVARVNGLPFPFAFPVVVDVGMIGAMVTASQLKLRGLQGAWLAYTWFAMLSMVSVVANGTHAMVTADMTRTTAWAAALIGAVPSATLLVMTHLVMWMVPDQRDRSRANARRERATTSTTHPAPLPAPVEPSTSLRLVAPEPQRSRQTVTDKEVEAQVLAFYRTQGVKPTGELVGEWLGGKSDRSGQRFIKGLEVAGLFDEPDLRSPVVVNE